MPGDPGSIPGYYVGEATPDHGRSQPAMVPADVLDRHLLITGQTGSGKSTTATQAIRTGHATTDGATIVIDPKGDGWPTMIGRSLYADRCVNGRQPAADVFQDVLYFDADLGLPQLPLCDIRPAVNAGVTRIDAAETVAEDVIRMVELLLPDSDDAVRAPDVIKALVLALFDPETGADAYPISELYAAATELAASRSTPPVSTAWLQQILDRTTSGSERVFSAIQQGVNTRLSKLVQDPYLRSMFDAVDEQGFRFARLLDDDVLIIVDLSAITPRAQRVVAQTVLRRLWRALEWRQASLSPTADPTRVSLWIDEVPHLNIQRELSELLAMGRGFGLSVVPLLQFPQQIRTGPDGERVYRELLNNIGSVLSGQLDDAPLLAQRLATQRTSPDEVATLLGSCPDDRWVFSPATSRSLQSQQSPLMVLQDPPLPPGHPEGDAPLRGSARAIFKDVWEECRRRTIQTDGVEPVGYEPSPNQTADSETIERGLQHTLWLEDISLPEGASYAADADQIHCTDCGAAFLPQFSRLLDALTHCHDGRDLTTVDLPVTDIGLTAATPDRVMASPLSLRQIMFLRLIERAERREIDPREWDLTDNSMTQLRNAVGLGSDTEESLVADGYLTRQPDFRKKFYRLTPVGRQLLADVRNGADPPGTRSGDPNESIAHIRLIEITVVVLEELIADPDTPVERVERYWSPPDQNTVVDIVAFDETDTPRIAVEAERPTNDLREGAPADYDVLASLESAAALWIVPDRTTGHRVVNALIDPDHGVNRLDIGQSDMAADTTPLSRYALSADGCADIVTATQIDRETILSVLE